MFYLRGRSNRIRLDVGGKREREVEGVCRLLVCIIGNSNDLYKENKGGIDVFR